MFLNYYRGKKVFVTGHTGFKGAWLSLWLKELGAEVTGYSIDVPSKPALFEMAGLSKALTHLEGDVCQYDSLEAEVQKAQPEIVFHMAAQALVRPSYDSPRDTFSTNLMGTVNLLDALRKTPSVKVGVIITTDKCYENKEWEFGYRENDPLGGKDPYSASKACAEIATHAYHRSFFSDKNAPQIVTARAGNVIGGGDWSVDRILPDCVRAWSKKDTVVIRSPHSIRPWQHVLEPLAGYLWLGAKVGQSSQRELAGESYNFGPRSDSHQTVEGLIGEFKKTWPECSWKVDTSQVGSKKEAGFLKLSCDKAFQHLGWQATLSFQESVQLTAEWYRRFYQSPGASADASNDVTFSRDLTLAQIRSFSELAQARGSVWMVK